MEIIVYTRPDCPLCDEALELIESCGQADYRLVNVEDRIDLLRRYGDRVPVLSLAGSGAELGWPFNAENLQAWLASA